MMTGLLLLQVPSINKTSPSMSPSGREWDWVNPNMVLKNFWKAFLFY